MADLKAITYSYPNNLEFEYVPYVEVVDLEEEKKDNILYKNGFIISGIQSSFKKDLKNPNGIYSPKFGQTLQDINPFADRYKCRCGNINQRVHLGELCPICNTTVKFVDDDYEKFGWMVLENYHIIHPNMYKVLQSYIGKNKFMHIIGYEEKKDQNGHKIIVETPEEKPKDEPFWGIGIIEFKERFEEIINFYYQPKKKDKYEHIMENIDKVFTNSIPVSKMAASF